MTALTWVILAALMLAAICTIVSQALADLNDHIRYAREHHRVEEDADWHETPTFRDLCAEQPQAVDALAVAEAARADWDEPSRWSK